MKENSIENLQNKKYFKNIDEAIKVYEEFRRYKDNGFIESIDPDFFFNLTDMFLSDYKRVLKENEELKESNRKLYEIGQEMCKQDKYTSENYIPVQKVKDKIKILEKLQNEFLNNEEVQIKIISYKELLEGRK